MKLHIYLCFLWAVASLGTSSTAAGWLMLRKIQGNIADKSQYRKD